VRRVPYFTVDGARAPARYNRGNRVHQLDDCANDRPIFTLFINDNPTSMGIGPFDCAGHVNASDPRDKFPAWFHSRPRTIVDNDFNPSGRSVCVRQLFSIKENAGTANITVIPPNVRGRVTVQSQANGTRATPSDTEAQRYLTLEPARRPEPLRVSRERHRIGIEAIADFDLQRHRRRGDLAQTHAAL